MGKESEIRPSSGIKPSFTLLTIGGYLTDLGGVGLLWLLAEKPEALIGSGIIGAAMAAKIALHKLVRDKTLFAEEKYLWVRRNEPSVPSDPQTPAHQNNGDR
jgi:hypothetical protein